MEINKINWMFYVKYWTSLNKCNQKIYSNKKKTKWFLYKNQNLYIKGGSFFFPIFCIYRLKMQKRFFSWEDLILNIFWHLKVRMKTKILNFINFVKKRFSSAWNMKSWKINFPQIKNAIFLKNQFLPKKASRSCFYNF